MRDNITTLNTIIHLEKTTSYQITNLKNILIWTKK